MAPDLTADNGHTLAIAVDVAYIVRHLLPTISLRSWRSRDADGKCPAGALFGGRKLWIVQELQVWTAAHFPTRRVFENEIWPAFEAWKAPTGAGGASR